MQQKISDALNTIKITMNAALRAGLFNELTDASSAHNAFVTIENELRNGQIQQSIGRNNESGASGRSTDSIIQQGGTEKKKRTKRTEGSGKQQPGSDTVIPSEIKEAFKQIGLNIQDAGNGNG